MLIQRKRLYSNSFAIGNWNVDEKNSTLKIEVSDDIANRLIDSLKEQGATYYETSKAHFYELTLNCREVDQYIIYK